MYRCWGCFNPTNAALPYWGVAICGKQCMAKLEALTEPAKDWKARAALRVFLAHTSAAKEAYWQSQERKLVSQLSQFAGKPSASTEQVSPSSSTQPREMAPGEGI